MTSAYGVSYIIPLVGEAALKPQSLAALSGQVGDFDREFLFVDDGSVPDAAHRITAITRTWTGAVTHVLQSPPGLATAINVGLMRAAMPFVKPVCPGDVLAADASLVLLAAAVASRAFVVFGRARLADGTLSLARAEPRREGATIEWVRHNDPLSLVLKAPLFHIGQLLARSVAVRIAGGCDEHLTATTDYSLALRLAALGGFCEVGETVVAVGDDRFNGARREHWQQFSMACANFLQETANLPQRYHRMVLRRLAAKATFWAARQTRHHPALFSRYFWLGMMGHLPGPWQVAPLIRRLVPAFEGAGDTGRFVRSRPISAAQSVEFRVGYDPLANRP